MVIGKVPVREAVGDDVAVGARARGGLGVFEPVVVGVLVDIDRYERRGW